MHNRGIILTLCFIIVVSAASAQRLDAIGKEDPFKLSGSVSTNQVAYFSNSLGGRRDPYNLFVAANLNADIYGWSVPLGFSFSNRSKGAFQQPFNQYSLNPTYKWITAHLGYTSMSFSNYTLNGHLFAGIGLDLAPNGPFKFSVMYGRLQKAVLVDTLINDAIEPAYQRMGYGFKAGYSKDKNAIELVVFKAKDNLGSNPDIPSKFSAKPQDNLVSSISVSKMLYNKLSLNAEFAISVLTRDLRAGIDSVDGSPYDKLGFLLRTNNSTTSYTAYKTGLSYEGRRYRLGLGYERVEPEYRTLGSYYFANDFENITANLSTAFLKNKLTLSTSTGIQRDDLRKDKVSSMKRFVGALNLGYRASKKLNLSATYSNFQAFVNVRSTFDQVNSASQYDNLDTLNYTQLSQNFNVTANYILTQSKTKTKVFNGSIAYMTSADRQAGKATVPTGNFINLNTTYSVNYIPKNMSLNGSFNFNRSEGPMFESTMLGPTLGITKSYFNKKLRSALSSSYNMSFGSGQQGSRVMNIRLNNSYSVKKKHNVNLSMVGMNRSASKTGLNPGRSFNEFTTTLGYNYNF